MPELNIISELNNCYLKLLENSNGAQPKQILVSKQILARYEKFIHELSIRDGIYRCDLATGAPLFCGIPVVENISLNR